MSSSGSNTKNASGWDGGTNMNNTNMNNTNNHATNLNNPSNPRETDGGGPSEGTSEGAPLAMSLTSDEVNYLVFRYLQESGFVHSAFTFVYESMLGKTNIRNGDRTIPPGALISFLQKGLQYVGIEENLHRESKKGQKISSKTEKVDLGAPAAVDEVDFSLLSQPVMAALTRTNPPIQLNLPPAAAAAAVKARLETEAKLQVVREDQQRQVPAVSTSTLTDQQMSPNTSASALLLAENPTLPQQQQQQQQTMEQASIPDALNERDTIAAQAAAAQAVVAQAAAAQAAATSGVFPYGSASQQPRVPGDTQSRLTGMQIALQQQQKDQEQQPNNVQAQQQQPRTDADAQGLLSLSSSSVASTKTAKRSNAEKRSLKKNKANKKAQQQQQQQQQSAAGTSNPLHLISQASATPGFSSLEEAVARLEASQNLLSSGTNSNTEKNAPQPMDVEENNNQGVPSSSSSSLMPADAQLDSTKTSARQEILNGQHASYQPNGSRSATTNQPMQPLNGKSAAVLAVQALTEVSSQKNKQPPDSLSSAAAVVACQSEQQPPLLMPPPPIEADSSSGTDKIDREDRITNALPSEILELRMHSSEVFMCAWNPVFTSFIATGSGDASARIWQMGGVDAEAGLGPVRLLPHGEDPRDKKNKDVTTLEWSSDGNLLATGSYDGVARVWSRSGALLHTLRGHKGPIFSLKWNKRGNYLLSGSYDKTTIVWDVSGSSGFVKQQFNDHQAPALDVDWKDDTTFASCSTDKTVNICKVGVSRPIRTFAGHTDEVNAVKWDPSGMLLASCSDDCTAKVWDVSSDRTSPLQDFTSHRQEIYTVKWSPTGPGSQNPTKQRILATASFDGSVRLWNVQDGSCIRVFSRHRDSVYSVAFSPSGSFLASGSLAGQLYIWNVQEGRPVKSYKGKGDIFEVAWNKEETRVAACFSSNIVAILDFKIRP